MQSPRGAIARARMLQYLRSLCYLIPDISEAESSKIFYNWHRRSARAISKPRWRHVVHRDVPDVLPVFILLHPGDRNVSRRWEIGHVQP